MAVSDALPKLPKGDLWVFGYGSLMWRPGFDYLETHAAHLYGYHRSLCVWSWYHRGTQAYPGLVLGLDLGGSCVGRLFRIASEKKEVVAAYLYEREMITPVYIPRYLRIRCRRRRLRALTFTVDRQHPQYAGKLDTEREAEVVCRARGISGCNREYVENTLTHLLDLGIHDLPLYRLCRELTSRSTKPPINVKGRDRILL